MGFNMFSCLLVFFLVCHQARAQITWQLLSKAGDSWAPEPREGHTSVSIGGKVYVFGGCNLQGECFNDLHVFNRGSSTWSRISVTGDVPAPRKGHSATSVRGYMVIFGGENNDGSFNDVYKFDPQSNRWMLGELKGQTRPQARSGHAATTDGSGKIYIFGGYNAAGAFFNDMWILDLNILDLYLDEDVFPFVFKRIAIGGQRPSSRENCSLTAINNKLYLIGGYGPDGIKEREIWVYDLETNVWKDAAPQGMHSPAGREGHVALRNANNIILVGGCDVTRTVSRCYNDIWSFNTTTMTWTLLSGGNSQFTARELHSASFISGGTVIMFGGAKITARIVGDSVALHGFDSCPGEPASCSGHGKCFEGFSCVCNSGWGGHDCGEIVSCPFDCSGHGSCGSDGTCSCNSGYIGPACFSYAPCPNNCSGHGSCSSDHTCDCAAGYYGDSCEYGKGVAASTPQMPNTSHIFPITRAEHQSLGSSRPGAVFPHNAVSKNTTNEILVGHGPAETGMTSYQQGLLGMAAKTAAGQSVGATTAVEREYKVGGGDGTGSIPTAVEYSEIKRRENMEITEETQPLYPLHIQIVAGSLSPLAGIGVVVTMLVINKNWRAGSQ